MKKLALTTLIIHLSVLLYAQHDFRPGYIITLNNDTIKGLIDNNPDQENAVYCNFKNDSTSEIKTYASTDLKEYVFNDGKHYIQKNIKFLSAMAPSTSYFLERVSTGIINLYYIKNLGFHYYFIEKSDELYELTNEKISYIENGVTYTKLSEKYKHVFSMLMNDAPSIGAAIESTSFTKTAFVKLLEKYHTQLDKKNEFILYSSDNAKNKAKWKLRYGVAVGFNYTYINTSAFETYDPFYENSSYFNVEYAQIVSSNMPSVFGNPNTYHTINVGPGLFINLNNNSKNSIQFEVNIANKKFKRLDFSLSSICITAPLIYKRELRYYETFKPFFDVGICLYHEENITSTMNIEIKEPLSRNSQGQITYEHTSYKINPKNSSVNNMTNHFGFLAGFGYSYPLTKHNLLEIELRADYSENRFSSFLGTVTIASMYRYLNTGLIARISF
jgi:hypothetical protein